MSNKVLRLTEDNVIDDIQEFMRECDADSLAELFGHVFGMAVTVDVRGGSDSVYICTPIDGEYCDHRADELKDSK